MIKIIFVAELLPAARAGALTGPAEDAAPGAAGGPLWIAAPHDPQNRPTTAAPQFEQKLAMSPPYFQPGAGPRSPAPSSAQLTTARLVDLDGS
jgi:hypothetical protein